MARRLRLALLTLAAGCVDLSPPAMVTDDGPAVETPDAEPEDASPSDDFMAEDASQADLGAPGRDTPLPGDAGAQVDARRADVGDMAPDAGAPDTVDAPPPLRANGATCSGGSVCQSGICSEGVCCNQACTETCRSCKIAGSLGACIVTPTGQDPRSECVAEAVSTCRRAGGCDGAGACRLYSAGTVCVAASCSGTTDTPARTCNGQGVCQGVSSRSCSPYVCGPTGCPTSCTAQGQCIAGYICAFNICAPSPF